MRSKKKVKNWSLIVVDCYHLSYLVVTKKCQFCDKQVADVLVLQLLKRKQEKT